MKLLLDESVPRRLGRSFPESFTVHTVQEMGWAGPGNGRLLSLAAGQGFGAFVTVDRGIEHQQNVNELPLAVIIMARAPEPSGRTAAARAQCGGRAVGRSGEPNLPCFALNRRPRSGSGPVVLVPSVEETGFSARSGSFRE